MPSADAWAGSSFPLATWSDDVSKSTDFARVMSDDLTSIVAIRNGSALSAQNVRVETARSGESRLDLNGRQHEIDAIVFGYAGHATLTDTDLEVGDRFAHQGYRFEVISVLVDLENVLQAFCEVKQ